MITFLNTLLAWGLVAAAIPILIHLFTRKKLKILPFSTLRFLKLIQKEKIRQVRIRQILLLILRTLIILLLVLAFMRPTLKSTSFVVGQRARTAMVLIVDNSLSMAATSRGKSLLERSKERAREIIDMMQTGDELTLVTAARPARAVQATPVLGPDRALAMLESIPQTTSGTDLRGAFAAAYKALERSRTLNKEIYLLSDNRVDLGGDADLQVPPNTRVFVFNWPQESVRNLSLAGLDIKNQLFEVNKVVQVGVRVANSGDYNEKGKLVYLSLNGKRVGQSQVDVPMGEERQVVFRVVPETPGFQMLTAELESDRILLDNRRYALFKIPGELKILLVGEKPQDRLFVRLALSTGRGSKTFRLDERDRRALGSVRLSDYDAVFLCNVPRLDSDFARRLFLFVKNGGGAVVFLGDDVDLKNYNEQLFERFRLGELGETLGEQRSSEEILRLGKINFDHPLFQGVFSEEKKKQPGIESPAFRFAVLAHADRDADVVMHYSNEAPFLLEREVGDGKVLAFMTAANPSWSDLTFKGIFAPLVNRAARYVAGNASAQGWDYLCGQRVEINLGSEQQQVSILTPGGSERRVRPEIRSGNSVLVLENTQQAGFYKALVDGREQAVLAINFDPQEMQLPKVDLASYRKRLGSDAVFELSATEELAAALQRLRYGKELWQFFLALALAGMIAEMIVFREKGAEQGEENSV